MPLLEKGLTALPQRSLSMQTPVELGAGMILAGEATVDSNLDLLFFTTMFSFTEEQESMISLKTIL